MRAISADEKELLKQHFPSLRAGPKDCNEPQIFEIALVLAGGVSAGSYTAGVMDYLIEALDEWNLQKEEDRKAGRAFTPKQHVPHHDVILRIVTGSSAGGRNGAITASVLNYAFPHIYHQDKFAAAHPGEQQDYDGNLFYLAWVTRADIESLLDTSDITKQKLMCVLNDSEQVEVAELVVNYKGLDTSPGMRDWLAKPYQLRLTNTNLHGVPFAYDVRAEAPGAHQGFLMHADQLAFVVDSPSTQPDEPPAPDCIALSNKNPRSDPTWRMLGSAGLATGACPIAFQARDIRRNPADYIWRDSYFDIEHETPLFVRPSWDGGKPPVTHDYAAVDGGVINNEPFDLARKSLSGALGRNGQPGKTADRAVIVIDPLVEDPQPGPARDATLVKVLAQLIPTLIQHARLSAVDLVQILSPDVYSRFMISPTRTGLGGKKYAGTSALASGALGAWFGIFSEAYRKHDYFLGRRNAQKFLKTVFTLPANNSLFADLRWSDRNREDFRDPESTPENPHLQIIPVCGTALAEEPAPAWPSGAYDESRRSRVEPLIKARVYAFGGMLPHQLRQAILDSAKGKGIGAKIVAFIVAYLAGAWLWLGWFFARIWLKNTIITAAVDAAKKTDGLA